MDTLKRSDKTGTVDRQSPNSNISLANFSSVSSVLSFSNLSSPGESTVGSRNETKVSYCLKNVKYPSHSNWT